MKIIKTADLTDLALDWAVMKAKGDIFTDDVFTDEIRMFKYNHSMTGRTRYSTNWAISGQLIDDERITLRTDVRGGKWVAFFDGGVRFSKQIGDTALQAALRSFVTSRLGNNVEIPEELLNGNS